MKSLVEQAATLSGKESSQIKLKHVEEAQTRRLDMLLYEKSTETLPVEMRVLNTLQDAKVTHNAVLMVEEKSEEEMEGTEEGVPGKSGDKAVELIDETDGFRTVIANIEGYEEF